MNPELIEAIKQEYKNQNEKLYAYLKNKYPAQPEHVIRHNMNAIYYSLIRAMEDKDKGKELHVYALVRFIGDKTIESFEFARAEHEKQMENEHCCKLPEDTVHDVELAEEIIQ